MKKKITMEAVIAGLKFIAENRELSDDALADGLAKLGCDWTFDDWNEQFANAPQISLFTGVRLGTISCGSSIIINMGSRNPFNRSYGDDRFLSVDDDTSVYSFIRIVTGDDSYTKEAIEAKKAASAAS